MPRKNGHLSKEGWIVARELYESGRYASIEHVRDVVGAALNCQVPTVKSFYDKCEQEGWVKGANSAAIQQKVEKRIVDMFAEQDMPVEKMVSICIEGLMEHENIASRVVESMKKDIEETQSVSKYTEELVRQFMYSKAIRLKYLQEANKMAGNYDRDKEESPVVVQFDQAATEALLRRRAARADG